MNRLILKYGYPITAVTLLVFVWVVYRRLAGGVQAILPLAVAAVAAPLRAQESGIPVGRSAPDAALETLAADHCRRVQAGNP